MSEELKWSSNCKLCGKLKVYKTEQGFKKGLGKCCMSCANSIKMGGIGFKHVVDNMTMCGRCNKNLPVENFLHNKKQNKYYSYCKACHNLASAKYYQKVQKYSRYNMTKEDYDNMLLSQDNKCYTCKEELIDPHIDHSHKTNKVRGLLCHNCNCALGFVKDKTEILQNLINYLNKDTE